jgi:3-hydroxybutyryl-CoA dehydrogenase
MDIKIIGIIGAGTMGDGIAQVATQSGCEVVLKDVSEEYLRAGFEGAFYHITSGGDLRTISY